MVARRSSRWVLVLLGLGLYLSLRGYESLDGDQAYRLPLLLHQQDPSLYANDPFVRAFETFNPHAGYLNLLDAVSRPFGLTWGLLLLFAATFGLTAVGIDRLARLAWPDSGGRVGVLAVVLVMATRAGNIGTNHLFEPVLLDRLIALGLGWNALADVLQRPKRGAWTAPVWLGLAAWVHPSLGLQLELLLGATWVAIAVVSLARNRAEGHSESHPRDPIRHALVGLMLLGLAMLPQLLRLPAQSETLVRGMTPEAFLLWTAQVQSPQHMLPHLWRSTQWAAWFGFLVLAGLSLVERPEEGRAGRSRLWIVLGINLAGLLLGWVAIEGWHLWKVTVFQPFRMATVARGLALVLVAGRVDRLWAGRSWLGTVRVALLIAGLTSDLAFVVVVLAEVAFALGEWSFARSGERIRSFPTGFLGLGVLGLGLVYLHRVDTDLGTWRIVAGAAFGLGAGALRRLPLTWTTGRQVRVLGFAWVVPVFAMVAPGLWGQEPPRWASADPGAIAAWARFRPMPPNRWPCGRVARCPPMRGWWFRLGKRRSASGPAAP